MKWKDLPILQLHFFAFFILVHSISTLVSWASQIKPIWAHQDTGQWVSGPKKSLFFINEGFTHYTEVQETKWKIKSSLQGS